MTLRSADRDSALGAAVRHARAVAGAPAPAVRAVSVDGDRATVRLVGGDGVPATVRLRKADGRWRVQTLDAVEQG